MFDACYCLSPLLEPFGNLAVEAARRCYLEIFFEKCLVLFCGSTDQERAKRAPHSHILKVQLLHGIFGKPEACTPPSTSPLTRREKQRDPRINNSTRG